MRALIVLKRSKWERDLLQYGNEERVRKLYTLQNNALDRVYDSHRRQIESRDMVQESLDAGESSSQIILRDELDTIDFAAFDCVISLGGDNHFVYVSSYLPDGMPILGINSDPITSSGALLYFTAEQFKAQFNACGPKPGFVLEEWSRLQGELSYPDGRTSLISSAVSEISVRSRFPDLISRYLLRINDEEWEEQKSSGLLLSAGAGSTGWYRNAHPPQLQADAVFPKDAPYFRLIARELSAGKSYRYHRAQVDYNDTLEIISEMDGDVSVDTHPEFTQEFPPGCRARISANPSPLQVIRSMRNSDQR